MKKILFVTGLVLLSGNVLANEHRGGDGARAAMGGQERGEMQEERHEMQQGRGGMQRGMQEERREMRQNGMQEERREMQGGGMQPRGGRQF